MADEENTQKEIPEGLLPPHYQDTPYEDLPGGLQHRIDLYLAQDR